MDVAQIILDLELLEETLLNLEVTVFPPPVKEFQQQFLLCEEEIAKKLITFSTPQITKIQADLMMGECGGGPCVETPNPKIYEFGGFTGSKCELQGKLKPELEKIWGPQSEFVKQMVKKAKSMRDEFYKALKGLFKDVKNLIEALIIAFGVIGASIPELIIWIIAPPWNIAAVIETVLNIVRALKTIIVSFGWILVHLRPLIIVFLLFPKDKLKKVLSTIGAVIQIILKLLSPINILSAFIGKILAWLKKNKPTCERQRKRLRKKIKKATRKRNRSERRANRRSRKAGYPRWKDVFFDPDDDHISYGGDLKYTSALKITRNDVELEEDDDIEKFIDAMEGFDDTNEEIKGLEEQLENVCKGEVENLDTDASSNAVVDDTEEDGSVGEDEGLEQDFDLEVIRIVIANKGIGYENGTRDVVIENPPGFEGTQASATYTVRNGQVVNTFVTEFGSGYGPPTKAKVQPGDPNGLGAVLIPILGKRPKTSQSNNQGGSQAGNGSGFGGGSGAGDGSGNFTSTGASSGSPTSTNINNDPFSPSFVASEPSGDFTFKLMKIRVYASGSGYSLQNQPTLQPVQNLTTTLPLIFTNPPGFVGVSAEGTATILNGVIQSTDVTNPGSGYSSLPDVSVSGGGGSGLQLVAKLRTGTDPGILRVDILNGGQGYVTTNPPTQNISGRTPLIFTGPSGFSGVTAKGYADIMNGVIQKTVITDPGTGYNSEPNVTVSGGGTGAQLVGILNTSQGVLRVDILNGGQGYGVTSPPTQNILGRTPLIFTGPSGFSGVVAKGYADILNGVIQKAVITDPGTGYNSEPNVTVAGAGTGALLVGILNTSQGVLRVDILNGGSGYGSSGLFGPSVSRLPIEFTNPDGFTGRTGKGFVTLKDGGVDKAFLTDPGSGYIIPPILKVTTGGGQGAKLMAELFPNPEIREDSAPTSGDGGDSDENKKGELDFISDIEKLANGFDENLIDQLLDRLIDNDLVDINDDIQSVTNELLTYAVKFPDGTIQRGVTEDELEDLKERFTVEIRSTLDNIP